MPRYVDIEPYDFCRIVLHPSDPGFRCETLKTANVQEVKHGQWRHDVSGAPYCPVCMNYAYSRKTDNEEIILKWHPKYCPNCGAKMDLQD